MWIRYRLNYQAAGPFSRWHETLGTGDRAPTRCGLKGYPHHRIEAHEHRPHESRCGSCDRFRAKQPGTRPTRAQGHR